MSNKSHIKLDSYNESNSFRYAGPTPRNRKEKQIRDRNYHGRMLLDQINAVREHFELSEEEIIDPTLIRDDVVYVQFSSDWGYSLDFDKFDKDGLRANKKIFQLLNTSCEEIIEDGQRKFRYHVLAVINRLGVSEFVEKIESFLVKNTFRFNKETNEREATDVPANSDLLNNIEIIQIATLKAFWTDEPEIPFPSDNQNVWWEVWFRKTRSDSDNLLKALYNLTLHGCRIGDQTLELTEHIVKLVKGTSAQLSRALLVLDNLAELRNPQQISDFITHKDISQENKVEYLDDLKSRIDSEFTPESVLICLLDSGVNNKHPLLVPFLPDSHLYTYNDSWGTGDSEPRGGHGTGVAGLALYGDLTVALSQPERIKIFHGLESYKIYHHRTPNDPKLYGAITHTAVTTGVADRPNNPRVYCMTVTDSNLRFKGRPSAWSSAVDQIIFGIDDEPQLFIVSGGNVYGTKHEDYPDLNHLECIHDPGQAYNVITIGTYTRKDKINAATGLTAVARYGAMAPSNPTSLLFDNNYPNKPELVLEGGNSSTDGVYTSDHSDLKMLSLDADHDTDIFIPFGDTSGAAALASKLAAEIKINYPNYWPETIRALMVHSGEWTSEMLSNKSLRMHKKRDKINLLRTVGYGVPNLQKALYSAENNLTLVAERTIQPYKKEGGSGKYNDYHLYTLPWPKEALEALEQQMATLKITLSYYIEPNPGSRKFASHYQYASHQLDFEIIKRLETLEEFKARISKPEDEDSESAVNRRGEKWTLGSSSIKGSIRKDLLTFTGREMAERNVIAVFPKNGWYKNLKRQNKFNQKVRYSLIISIETDAEEVDLYTPVLTQISVKNKVEARS
ncbi:S8 family peptidase [Flavobacterium sp. HJSW_4]|uniref:S8 family peptidase n=1 Tax=Flavobacterium sp. HJSW_4 TaxID=3344660 RepID=UPI0035F3021D